MSAVIRTLSAAALSVLALPLAGRAEPLSWSDVITPDRIVQSVLQYGVMALRTQVDLKYGDMTVNLLNDRITLTDLQLWPLPAWDENVECEIRVDRLSLVQAPLDQTSRVRLKLSLYGITAPAICLPPQARGILFAVGLRELSLPNLSFDVDYDVASSGAKIRANGVVANIAAFDAVGDFSYLWVDGRDSMDNPDPVVELTAASLSLEDLGGWKTARTMLPPPMKDAKSAAPVIAGMLTGAFNKMNYRSQESGGPVPITPGQSEFIASATAAWAGFLADPRRIVLETAIPPGENAYVDFQLYEVEPWQVFADLSPRVSLAPAQARAALPVALLSKALGENAAALDAADLLRVGLALTSGIGAPRNIAAGAKILAGLARDGNAEAAQALSQVLETRQPDLAYAWALRAGAAGLSGTTARLDRIEAALPLSRVLEIQEQVSKGASHPVDALDSVAAIKEQARQRLTGRGQARSYGIAAMWAMLAAATGDAEAADILAEIDQRVARADAEGASAWAGVEARSSKLAMNAWVSRDLAASLGGGNRGCAWGWIDVGGGEEPASDAFATFFFATRA